MRALILILLIGAVSNSIETIERIGCHDEDGNMVDWYYLYKLPNKYSNEAKSGYEYLYITPKSSSWTLSKFLINSTSSMPGKTLSLIYDNNSVNDNLIAMYNDEPTNEKVDMVRGHTKGVVVANDISGFWLVHSVPKFPPAIGESYDYPHTGRVYGQSFLCISFTGDQMGIVGKQLQYNEPRFYSTQVPDYLKTIYPQIVEALHMNVIKQSPFHNLATLKSRSGATFTSFAKSGNFKKELYEDFVAPHYNAGDFYVESWRHGPGNINSDCTKPTKVYNIKDVSIEAADKIEFSTLKDHSKWMVSESNNLICVGDINRQEHQKVRGGGTVCIQHENLSKIYQEMIKDSEPCQRRSNFIYERFEIESYESNSV